MIDEKSVARALAEVEGAGPRASGLTVAPDGGVGLVLDVGGLDARSGGALKARVEERLRALPGVARVRTILTSERVGGVPAEPAPAPRPGRIVAVASGKGGVGKSTVAANLAVALAREGLAAGLLDADIHGPSTAMIMGVRERAGLEAGRIQPVRAHGVATLSMAMMADPDRAVAWRGPMASSAMAQMVEQTDWGPLDLLVIDMPPGTGDISLTLAQKVRPDGIVIVTTPQDLALIDARRAMALFGKLGVPVLGIVENMGLFTCPHCGEASAIFGAGGVEETCAQAGVPLLGRLPLDPAIRAASDAGTPPAAGGEAAPFLDLARATLRALEELPHAAHPPR